MKARLILGLFVVACLAVPAVAQINLPPVWPPTWVNTVDDFNMCNGCLFPESYVATANETGMITDLYVVGDSFTVFVNGNPVLTTPTVCDWTCYGTDPYGPPFTTDPNVAWNSGLFSKGTFNLVKGDIVTIQENSLPPTFTDGTYAITASTPEPGTLMLLGTGALGLVGVIRRKFNL